MTIEEKNFPLTEPETLADEPEAQPDELGTPAPLTSSPEEPLPDEPETPASTTGDPIEVPTSVANRSIEAQVRPWGYLIAGMGLAILAMALGAVLGYLARPALDSADSLSAEATRSVEETASGAQAPTATASTAQAPTNSIVDIVQTGGHSQGSPDAPVAIVEYSDFQCPYCGRHFKEVEGKLKEAYLKNGQVRLVYKHLTILGDESVWAALASECAADQNKFWEYHDLVFSRQNGENQGAFNQDNLKSWAKELGLDTAAFNDCLDTQKHLGTVQSKKRVYWKRQYLNGNVFFLLEYKVQRTKMPSVDKFVLIKQKKDWFIYDYVIRAS